MPFVYFEIIYWIILNILRSERINLDYITTKDWEVKEKYNTGSVHRHLLNPGG